MRIRPLPSRRLRRAATAVLLAIAALGAASAAPAAAAGSAPSTPSASSAADKGGPTPRYYLALGDSLAAGFQHLPGGGYEVGHGYAQDIARTLGDRAKAHHRAFDFTDLGCPGETTGSMIHGGCPFPHPYQGSQLAAAADFLRKHHKDNVVVTLDIGANDIDGCASGGSLDVACAIKGVADVRTDLDQILRELKGAAGPHTRIVGMNLYDPFLAAWLTGAKGELLAAASVPLADTLNATIDLTDARQGVPTADVASAFRTNSFLPLVPLNGRQVPLNVARIMQWTNMSFNDIHANDTGYQVIADTFLARI